ncbi:ribosomal RNA large subunit methyltransferase J, partial [Sphaeroforma arctica JP610]
MNVVPGASLVTGDFTKADTQAEVTKILQGKRADVVLSDMAPPASGQPSVDFDRLMNLCDAVLNFTKGNLKPGGTLVVKLLGGGDIKDFRTSLTQTFQSVKFAKPAASRSSSSESFVVATGFTQPKSSVEGSGTMQREVKTD